MKYLGSIFCLLLLLSCGKSPLEEKIASNRELREGIMTLMAERLEKDTALTQRGYRISLLINHFVVNDSIEKYDISPIIDPELLEGYPCKEIINYQGFYIFYREPVVDVLVGDTGHRLSEKEYGQLIKRYFPELSHLYSDGGRRATVVIYEPLPLYLYFKNGTLMYKKRSYGTIDHKLPLIMDGKEVFL